jgi:hypothetical protein
MVIKVKTQVKLRILGKGKIEVELPLQGFFE